MAEAFPTRGPEAVVCAHCTRTVGEVACPGCGLQVCAPCGTSREGCTAPRCFELRLGLGARLRSIDASCRWGLYFTPMSGMKRVDFDALSWERLPFGVARHQLDGQSLRFIGGEILRDGSLAGVEFDRFGKELVAVRFRFGAAAYAFRTGFQRVFFSRDEGVLMVKHVDERLGINFVAEEAPPNDSIARDDAFAPLPGGVVQAVACAERESLLACSGWGVVAVYTLRLHERLAITHFDGDCHWVGVAGDTVAGVVTSGGALSGQRSELRIWRLVRAGVAGKPQLRALASVPLGTPRDVLADIDRSGSCVVAATGGSDIVVYRVASGEVERLSGHSDGLSALRVDDNAHKMVSGDYDNRVLLWYGDGKRFAAAAEKRTLTRLTPADQ